MVVMIASIYLLYQMKTFPNSPFYLNVIHNFDNVEDVAYL